MASTQRTTYNGSDKRMSGWVTISIVGHLIILLILSTMAPQAFTRKQTPLQKKQLSTQKRIYEEQHKEQLQKKVQRMDEAYNELIEHRNRRVRQYQQLEEKMQHRLAEALPQQSSDAMARQRQIGRSFQSSGAAFDSLQTLQQHIQKNIKDEDFEQALHSLDEAHQHLKQLNKNIKELRSDLHDSNVRLDEMRDLLTWLNNDSLLTQIDEIKYLQTQVRKDLTKSQIKLDRYEKAFEKQLPNIEKKVENLEETEKSRFKKWSLKQRIKFLAKKDINSHDPRKSKEKQKSARDQLEKNTQTAQAKLKLGLPKVQFPQRQHSSGEQQSDLSNLLKNANERQQQTAEVYKEARAAELALIQNRAYNSVYQQLSSEKSVFSDDRPYDFPEDVNSSQDLREVQKSFDMASRDMDLILADIQAMREKAIQTRTSLSDSGLTDVTLAMRRESNARQDLAERAGPRGNQVQDLSRDMFAMLYPDQALSFTNDTGSMPPPMRLSMEHYGRKISPTGKPVKSFYINSWYMIGPFPNSRRTHINDVFPPETIIDLDAEYVGKHGPMRWEYCSSSTHFIKPVHFDEYGIYYAYTEFYSEEDTAVWMAFGSDDRLDFWINDIKVWQSGNNLKQWRPDEGFRKVYLKQGYNKMLARLENGYRECGFSVIVALQ